MHTHKEEKNGLHCWMILCCIVLLWQFLQITDTMNRLLTAKQLIPVISFQIRSGWLSGLNYISFGINRCTVLCLICLIIKGLNIAGKTETVKLLASPPLIFILCKIMKSPVRIMIPRCTDAVRKQVLS